MYRMLPEIKNCREAKMAALLSFSQKHEIKKLREIMKYPNKIAAESTVSIPFRVGSRVLIPFKMDSITN